MTNSSFPYIAESFADIQLLRYELPQFDKLPLSVKKYLYYLSEATLAGRDITFDQNGAYNLLLRQTLEAIYLSYPGDRSDDNFLAIETYLKQLWFASGIHHHYNSTKFTPQFTAVFFREALRQTPASALPLQGSQTAEGLYDTLVPVLFDPTVMPMRVCIDAGTDHLLASAMNFYSGVTQAEAEQYYHQLREDNPRDDGHYPSYGLNSTLVKDATGIHEDVWRLHGKYSDKIATIIHWLSLAATVCETTEQRQCINTLIAYYTTGDLTLFDDYSIAWVTARQGLVDFINGFIEVYGDPLGIKGTWEGIVHYKDLAATQRTEKICRNAQWFEDHSPVDPRFKKSHVQGVTATVVNAAMLGGEEYPASAIGINLPNADWIRATHGSKSITIGNLTAAYNAAARGNGMRQEFIYDNDVITLLDSYGALCDDLHTDLHECLGHGSGQLLDNVSPSALKQYHSTIEEARADLFALYFIADEKMIELGILPDSNAYKAQYYSYLLNGLMTQLVRIPLGQQLQEAHMRNRAIIARWTLDHSQGAIELVNIGEKTYLLVHNYVALRARFAELLAEVQRIKSTGDYDAAKQLVETYGVTIPHDLHREVLQRYDTLHIPPYKGFINPRLTPIYNNNNDIIDVSVDYSETYTHQMLRYSHEY